MNRGNGFIYIAENLTANIMGLVTVVVIGMAFRNCLQHNPLPKILGQHPWLSKDQNKDKWKDASSQTHNFNTIPDEQTKCLHPLLIAYKQEQKIQYIVLCILAS